MEKVMEKVFSALPRVTKAAILIVFESLFLFVK